MLGIIAIIFSSDNALIDKYSAEVPLLQTTENLLFVILQIFSSFSQYDPLVTKS